MTLEKTKAKDKKFTANAQKVAKVYRSCLHNVDVKSDVPEENISNFMA